MMKGETQPFGWLVVRRAWTDTLDFFEAKTRTIVIAIIFLATGAGFHVLKYGAATIGENLGHTAIDTVAPVVAFGALVLLWHLWLAPAALAYEACSTDRPLGSAAPAKAERPIVWAPWRDRDEYSFYEFAKILAKTDPAAQTMNTEGSSYLRLLVEQAKMKKFKYIPDIRQGHMGDEYEAQVDGDTRLARPEALAWAKQKHYSIGHIE